MGNIKRSVEELIGNTPLLEPVAYEKKHDLKARILLKVESVNPLGSLKDRIALAMLDALEANTDIKPGDYVVEGSSGNTAIALAALARKRGYKFIALLEQPTEERKKLLAAYGAEVLDIVDIPEIQEAFKTIAENPTRDVIQEYFDMRAEREGKRYFYVAQWRNEANRKIQYSTTGQEIIRDTDGNVDVLVAGIGSGGSIRGVGDALKEVNPNLEIVVFDPTPEEPDSFVGVHKIEGMPEFTLPKHVTEKEHTYDRIVVIPKEDAYRTANSIAKEEGLFFGITTGAAVCVATQLAKQPEYEGKTIVTFAYDDVMKYLTTDLVDPKYADD